MRRAFSLVVAIVLLLSVVALPVPALAAEDTMTAWITDAEIANGQLGVSIFSREAIQRVALFLAIPYLKKEYFTKQKPLRIDRNADPESNVGGDANA